MEYVALVLWICFSVYAIRADAARQKSSAGAWLALIWFVLMAAKPVSIWLSPGAQNDNDFSNDGGMINFIVLFVLAMAATVLIWAGPGKSQPLVRRNFWLVLLFGFSALSLVWADMPFAGIKGYMKEYGHLAMVVLVLREASPAEAMVSIFRRCGYILVPLSVMLIRYFPELGRRYAFWNGEVTYVGAMISKNAMGAFSMFACLFFLWALVTRVYPERRSLDTLILLMALDLLWMANNSTAQVTFVIGALIMFGRRTALVRKIVAKAHVLIVVAIAAECMFGVSSMIAGHLQQDSTFASRVELWGILGPLQPNRLLGAGFASFWTPQRLGYLAQKYWWAPTQAHNGYMETYLDLGLIGLCILIALIVTTQKRVGERFGQDGPIGFLLVPLVLSFVLTNVTEAYVAGVDFEWVCFLLVTTYTFATEVSVHKKANIHIESLADRAAVMPRPREGFGLANGGSRLSVRRSTLGGS